VSRADFLSAITGHAVRDGSAPVPFHTDVRTDPLWEVLGRVALFSHLDRAELDRLVSAVTIEHWPAGTTVLREGDEGDDLHVVLAGRARAFVGDRVVGELLAGDPFGEIAIIHGVPRQATLVADEDLTTCRVPGAEVLAAATRLNDVRGS
jgi:CRP-like cAMP-binding protein